MYAADAELNVTDTSVTGNTASEGGGLYVAYTTLNISDTSVTGNIAAEVGGLHMYRAVGSVGRVYIADNTLIGMKCIYYSSLFLYDSVIEVSECVCL